MKRLLSIITLSLIATQAYALDIEKSNSIQKLDKQVIPQAQKQNARELAGEQIETQQRPGCVDGVQFLHFGPCTKMELRFGAKNKSVL